MRFNKLIISLLIVCKINGESINALEELLSIEQIQPVIIKNREILSKVNCWVTDETYSKAVYWYGLPPSVRHLIDLNIGNEITYSDVIVHLSGKLKEKINYLELGVSVGKNFFQIVNSLKNSTCTGFELEKINPILENLLGQSKLLNEWETFKTNGNVDKNLMKQLYGERTNVDWWELTCMKQHSLKKGNSGLSQYSPVNNSNEVFYLNGDIFDECSWSTLKGNKYNLIFSDAFHNMESLYHEYEMIKKYELLNENEFIIIWDDLGGAMTDAFMKIWDQIYKKYNNKVFYKLIKVRGWLGVNEIHHTVGIIAKTNG